MPRKPGKEQRGAAFAGASSQLLGAAGGPGARLPAKASHATDLLFGAPHREPGDESPASASTRAGSSPGASPCSAASHGAALSAVLADVGAAVASGASPFTPGSGGSSAAARPSGPRAAAEGARGRGAAGLPPLQRAPPQGFGASSVRGPSRPGTPAKAADRQAAGGQAAGGQLPGELGAVAGGGASKGCAAQSGPRWTLSDLRVLRTVGTGFIGSVRVVKLRDGSDPAPYALKIMKKAEVIRRKQVAHVMQEVQLLRQVDHPFIVKHLCSFQDKAHLCIVMEYLNGGELFRLIRKSHRLSPVVARFFSGEVVLALGHLHSMDIVYRDLKPENTLIDCEGHLKITDLGFAKVVPTRTWTVCGTPEYVAPEIISTKGHSKPVDWWALGILVFEMLAGHSPFVAKSSQEIHAKVLGQDPVFPKHIKEAAASFIGELLVKDKARRLGSGAGGVQDVKDHSWFESVDWDLMARKMYSPPIAPQVRPADDTSLFDGYPEEPIDIGATSNLSPEEQRQFEGF